MDEGTIRKIARSEVSRAMNVILTSLVDEKDTNDVEKEGINELFPGMGPIDNRPIVHPYGYASRAPEAILNVTAKVGEHIGNRMVIGHRDKRRPKDLERGESVLYSTNGQTVETKIYARKLKAEIISKLTEIKSSEVKLGESPSDNAVLFNEVKTLLESLIDLIVEHTHLGNAAVSTGPPENAVDFTAEKANISNIKSDVVFLE